MSSEQVYKIVESCDRGKIAVATRDIMPGELVLWEKEPVLHISNEFISQQSNAGLMAMGVAVLKKFVVDLSPDQKAMILSLFGPTDITYSSMMRQMISQMVKDRHLPAMDIDSYLKVYQVFNFNAFELGAHGHGVFAEFTRLSHSCAPNCSYSFRGTAVYCHARKFIQSGEELTISYKKKWDLEPTHERRYLNLQMKDFTCHCPRCDALGDDTRQFDCFDPDCKGVMMVCQPINKRPILLTGVQYTGVTYVEPHLLPCTVCHRAAPADYQTKMFELETWMHEQGPRLMKEFTDFICQSKNAKKESELMELLYLPNHRRHVAALPFLRTRMKLSAFLLLTEEDTSPHALADANQAALEFVAALFQLLPFPSDNLSDELSDLVNAVPILSPNTERIVCGEALRMFLLLYGRDRRTEVLDAAMLRYREKNPSAQSTEICAFCEESPQRAAFTLSRCGRCKQVCYCSTGCQKAHWKLHKKTCKAPEGK